MVSWERMREEVVIVEVERCFLCMACFCRYL
jgi:hypothetical protein